MNHKLQVPTSENNGPDSVVRNTHPETNSEIASNDAGFTSGAAPAIAPEAVPERDSGTTEGAVSPVSAATLPVERPGRGRPEPRGARPEPRDSQPRPTLPTTVVPEALRCEVARSDGYDPTGERAIACGAPAQVLCEYCGPMCSSCAEETFCFYSEHELSALGEPGPLPTQPKRKRKIREVVYVEIKCPKCRRVRLALPKNHRPKARRKCPVCKTEAPAEYLAHGFTRRRLPYHEVFAVTEPAQLTILPGGKRRLPWDVRDLADYRDE